ncbi:MAG: 16S rRNA (cytosine(1402)-N(4))-methyltransferase [Planctomycetaceae bacterium]|nr:16S rRNA (cytosine(1402)-N(4))-methyltransferase [Planctomycetaceae bacterium]
MADSSESHPKQRSRGKSTAVHVPVLMREVLKYLDLQTNHLVVDGTVGAAGHSQQIVQRIGIEGLLIGLDRDPMMLQFAAEKLGDEPNHVLVHSSYSELPEVLESLNERVPNGQVDRILLDLGLSSDQLADEERGFSFESDGALDLRFDTSVGEPAFELLRRLDAGRLEQIFRDYGEERFARPIAERIAEKRGKALRTASDLTEVVSAALPQSVQKTARKHPATRVFQALRIAVNEELTHLDDALKQHLFDSLARGGRLVVISFHSLEDRLVKQTFRGETWQNLTSKPITASPKEQRMNPRSRTAKLRAAIKK